MTEIIHKPWGSEELFSKNEQTTVKIMNIKKDARNSLHYHRKKDEIVHCLSGTGILQVSSNLYKLVPGATYNVKRDIIHRIRALESLKILEISIGETDENDIKRFEDDYGRI